MLNCNISVILFYCTLYFIFILVLSSKNDINHKSQKIKKNVYPTHPFKMICTLCNSKMCCCSIKTFNQTKHAWNRSNNDWFSRSPLQGSSKGASHVSFFLFIFTHTHRDLNTAGTQSTYQLISWVCCSYLVWFSWALHSTHNDTNGCGHFACLLAVCLAKRLMHSLILHKCLLMYTHTQQHATSFSLSLTAAICIEIIQTFFFFFFFMQMSLSYKWFACKCCLPASNTLISVCLHIWDLKKNIYFIKVEQC